MTWSPGAVRAAFGDRLNSLVFSPAFPIVPDNIDDPGGTYKLETNVVFNQNNRFGIGIEHQYTGFFQVTVVMPSGEGAVKADNVAKAISDHFPVDLKLTAGEYVVRVTSTPDIAGGYDDDHSDWRVPVTVYFESWD